MQMMLTILAVAMPVLAAMLVAVVVLLLCAAALWPLAEPAAARAGLVARKGGDR